MKTLLETIKDAENRKVAIGHFNISELAAFRGIWRAAEELKVPVIIGVSEGEREYIGFREAAALVKIIRESRNFPIFINADHTYSIDKIKEAAKAGYDSVIFDGAKLPFEENITKTKEAVEAAKSINPDIIVEAELGYIGSSSKLLDKIPEGAGLHLTTPEEAAQFVKKTKIDMFAPAVGNIHGMLKNQPEPRLRIELISKIRAAAGVPLVLHGASGNTPEDLAAAIEAGISLIHINTEIRAAWRRGLEESLKNNPDEVAPYKLLPSAEEAVRKVVLDKLRIFNRLS